MKQFGEMEFVVKRVQTKGNLKAKELHLLIVKLFKFSFFEEVSKEILSSIYHKRKIKISTEKLSGRIFCRLKILDISTWF